DDGDHLPVGLVLARLLDARVDVADDRLDVAYHLALERCDQAQHPVRGGMVRADVQRQQLMRLALARGGARDRDRLLAGPVVLGESSGPAGLAVTSDAHTSLP